MLNRLARYAMANDSAVRIRGAALTKMVPMVYRSENMLENSREKLTKKHLKGVKAWKIDLGDVRESARVYINGQLIGCAWSVPFVLDCRQTLKKGDNEIRIEVTNLPANRISDLDRRGIKWRKMEDINVVDISYKKTTYDQWTPMPSGLHSEIKLIKK